MSFPVSSNLKLAESELQLGFLFQDFSTILCSLEGAPLSLRKKIVLAQAAITKYLLGQLKHKHLFLTVLEAGSTISRFQQIWFLIRAFFLPRGQPPCHCIFTWPFLSLCAWRERNLCHCRFLLLRRAPV